MGAETPPRDALQDFAVFAEELNFTRAAARLGVSQPSLHGKVSKLSQWAGVALYEKHGRSLSLTEAGERLASLGREQGEALRRVRQELQTGSERQPVRLAAGEGALLYLLGPGLKRFAKQRPNRLAVLPKGGAQAVQLLTQHRCDLAVWGQSGTAFPERLKDDGLHRKLLARSKVCVLMFNGDPLSRREDVGVQDLIGRSLLTSARGQPLRESLEALAAREGVNLEVALALHGWPLTLELCKLGLGLAVVNDIVRYPRGLVAKPLRGLPPLRYELLTPGPLREQRPVVRELAEALISAASR